MKNFNQESWNSSLLKQNWECLGNTENVNDMAILFTNMALDECAPMKTYILK